MPDVMTARELPVMLIATMLVLGAGFTLAINSMLGGTVQKAPMRAGPADRATPSDQTIPFDRASYPKEAGSRRIWRSSATEKDARPRREEGRSRRSRTRQPARAARPAPSTPASGSPPSSSNPPSTPPPPRTERAPSPKPKPAPRPNRGGEDFYSTG